MPPPPLDMALSQHPKCPASYPHICISETVVTQHITHALWDAATQSTYFEYIEQKFEGISHPATSIQWQIIRYALKRFKSADRRVLTKFIHEWLPLLDRHHTVRTSIDKTCPSCRQAAETVDHFLSCPHVERTSVWKELHKKLQKHQIKHTVSTVFHNLLAFGLYTARSAGTNISFHHAPCNIQTLFEQQARLGWRQLYYG